MVQQILSNTYSNTYSIDGGFVKWYINKYLEIMIHSVNNTYSIDGGFVKWYINKYLEIL